VRDRKHHQGPLITMSVEEMEVALRHYWTWHACRPLLIDGHAYHRRTRARRKNR